MDLTKVFFTHDIRKGIKFDAILKWGGFGGTHLWWRPYIYDVFQGGWAHILWWRPYIYDVFKEKCKNSF